MKHSSENYKLLIATIYISFDSFMLKNHEIYQSLSWQHTRATIVVLFTYEE